MLAQHIVSHNPYRLVVRHKPCQLVVWLNQDMILGTVANCSRIKVVTMHTILRIKVINCSRQFAIHIHIAMVIIHITMVIIHNYIAADLEYCCNLATNTIPKEQQVVGNNLRDHLESLKATQAMDISFISNLNLQIGLTEHQVISIRLATISNYLKEATKVGISLMVNQLGSMNLKGHLFSKAKVH